MLRKYKQTPLKPIYQTQYKSPKNPPPIIYGIFIVGLLSLYVLNKLK